MADAAGVEKEAALREAGFTDGEVQQWKADTAKSLQEAGFAPKEVDQYFGAKNPDMAPVKQFVEENLKSSPPPAEGTKKAEGILGALEAGFQMSVTGLVARGKAPDTILPEDASTVARIASQIGTLAGDVPAIAAGALGGSTAGAAAAAPLAVVPGIGLAVEAAGATAGGYAGAMALPAAMRQMLMDHYQKGDIHDFGDFWERASAVLWEAAKGGATGLATAGAGPAASRVLGPAVGPITSRVAEATAEIGTMVTVGKALEGQVPNAQDFLDAAMVIGTVHGISKATGKLQSIYAKTGVKPADVAIEALQNPVVKQEILSSNVEVPRAYESKIEGTPGQPGNIVGAPDGLKPAPAFEYTYSPMDTSQPTVGKIFYHGTKGALSKLSEADVYGKSDVRNLYGEGLYLTDNPNVAKSYAENKGKGPDGQVLAGKLGNLNLIDLEKPLPEPVRELFNQYIEEQGGERVGSQAKGSFVYDRLKEAFQENGLTQSDVVEIYGDLNAKLSEAGYDGLRHQGGGRVKGKRDLGSHNVVVLFEDVGVRDGQVVGRLLKNKIQDVPFDLKPLEPNPQLGPAASKANLSDAAKKVLSSVGEKGEKESKGYSGREFYKDWVDKLDPINEAVKILKDNPDSLPADEHPYLLSRMANDASAKVKFMMEKGGLDYETLAKKGKSFKEIIDPHIDDLQNFEAYLLSKRAVEVEGRGLKSGIDLDAAREVIKGGGKYEKAANELVEFQNNVLKYVKDSGVISEKSLNSMIDVNKAYIPFSRISESSESAGGKKGKSSSLKAFKGSDLKVQSPLQSILENTEALVKLAEKNRAVSAFVDLAESNSKQSLIEKVPTKLKPIEVKSEEIARALREQGIENVDPEAFNIFRPQNKMVGDNEFQVFRDGKREIYRVSDDAPAGLAEALKSLDGDATSMNILMRLARGITTVKRIGISLTPDFIAKNLFRDQLTSGVFSKGGAVPFTDIVGALGDLLKKNDVYYDWLKAGGANGTFLDLNKNYLEKNIFGLNKETGFLDATWNLVQKPAELLKVTGELAEQATRLAEFKRVTKGETKGSKIFEGGFASREVTIDFQRMGAKLSAMNAITAFMNVQVQGFDKLVRAIKDDPAAVSLKAFQYITLPSLLLWWANKDDERYKRLERWEKDAFWIIPTKDHLYRIPKPQELGVIFGTLPERALDAFFTDNPRAFKDFNDTITKLVIPSFVPDAIAPAMEHWANKSSFTGRAIVPANLEKVLPEYQYTEYTSETAKVLGKFSATVMPGGRTSSFSSPAVLQNYIRSWSGTVGQYALQLADQALYKSGAVKEPIKPTETLADIPFIKAFVVRYPSASTAPITDFHERFKESQQVVDTIHHLAKQGDLENMEKELKLVDNQDKLVNLKGMNTALSNMTQYIHLVYRNPDMKPYEKRQIIDGIYSVMTETAEAGNKIMDELEKGLKKKK